MENFAAWIQMAAIIAVVIVAVKAIKRMAKMSRLKAQQEKLETAMKMKKAQRYLEWAAMKEVEGREGDPRLKSMEFMTPRVGGKFTVSSFGGKTIAYCFNYYPRGKMKEENPIWEENRKMVWDFKLGNYQAAQVLVTDFIRGHFSRAELRDMMFCVIPASSFEKNERRYRKFCEAVAADTGIENGMDVIRILYDRDNSREAKTNDVTFNLDFGDECIGKRVILFDDVFTRGALFKQCSGQLLETGADEVIGLFLGKTIS